MLEFNLELTLPYVTADLPGTGGTLRASPEHFVVEEIPLYEASGDGQHLYVNLTKVGLTTKDVQFQLERLFGLKRDDVGFAGLKDKVARTTQTFSLGVGQKPATFAAEAAARIAAALPVTVHWARFHHNKLRPGHLLGNRFTITISELPVPPAEALLRAAAIVERLQTQGVPNFFGPQRLGSSGQNVRQGLAVLMGERSKQDRWLRRFLISSVQSYLCNRYLTRRVEEGTFERLMAGDVAKKYATGGMFDVVDLAAEQARYAAREISFTAPIYGPRMWAAKSAAGALEMAVLAEAPLTMEHFARAHVEGTRRLGRLLVPDLAVSASDQGLMATFVLSKGAFATTVLRELMKVEGEQLPAIDQDDEE